MAKKTRKPNLPQETLERARREMAQGGPAVEQSATPVVAASAQASSKTKAPVAPRKTGPTTEADLRSQYAYVMTDLQGMAILAGALIVILLVLTFFI